MMLSLFVFAHASAFAADDGIFVDRSQYANRPLLPDFTAAACPDTPRGLEQIKSGNDLYCDRVACESKSMPYNDLLDFYYDGWIETLDWLARQDVDVIDVGHCSPATKADEAALRTYLVDLHQQVLDFVRSGQLWDQLYRSVRFSDEVKKWTAFDTMHTLNVLGMYRWVTNHRRGEW